MREPDLVGVGIRIWKINYDAYRRKNQHKKEWGYKDSTIGLYVVNGPFHPFWSWWYLSCVHLRDIPGALPAKKHFAEAEYELTCLSLNPDPKDGRPKVPDIDGIEKGEPAEKTMPGFLQPPDFVVQFHLNTELPEDVRDRQAAQILDHAAQRIAYGMSCDSDFRSWWENSIKGAAEHYRKTIHT